MSEFSQPLSTCSRTTDFSFVFNNSAFSDAVLVLLTLKPKGVSIPWRLASSFAQLFVSAVEVSATTLTSTVAVGDSWYAAGKALGSLGQTVVSRLSPKDSQEVSIACVYQVNSALLAASSPYLRQLIQQPPYVQHLVPGLTSVVSRHKQRKLVTVLLQPHHISAAEAVIKFIFTNDIALTGTQQALDALLVAEQLQVPDCAEVCQHYLEDCAMDWPVALTLVHLQHKHQQEQQQQRQQRWQRQQSQQQGGAGGGGGGGGGISSSRKSSSGASLAPPRLTGHQRGSVIGRNSSSAGSSIMGSGGLLKGLGGSSVANTLDAIAPLLPVPSESVYLQGLLLRAQDFLVHQFEDLELVLSSAEGRQRLLLLPYDALRAILGHSRLKVASENTALLAAAGWLHANAAQASSLLLSPNSSSSNSTSSASNSNSISKSSSSAVLCVRQSSGGALDDAQSAQSVYNSALYNSTTTSNGEVAGGHATSNSNSNNIVPPATAAVLSPRSNSKGLLEPHAAAQNGAASPAGAAQQQQQQQQAATAAAPTASGASSLLLDLCQVLRLCQCSYTYVLHILPQLPLFRDEPRLVAALQFEVMRFRAAGKLRQRRLAAEAAAAAAAAAAEDSLGLNGHPYPHPHLALGGVSHPLSQVPPPVVTHVAGGVKLPGGGSGSDSSIELVKGAPMGGAAAAGPTIGVWADACGSPAAALAEEAAAAGVGGCVVGGQGWRGCTPADAALLQCQLRPESARSALDFSFTFDPQVLLTASEQKAAGRGNGSSMPGAGAGAAAAGGAAIGGGAGAGAAGGGVGATGGSSSGGGSTGSSGVDLMQRLLGLTPQQASDATIMSEDQYFAGYVWNMVVARDGFVGVSWRVVLPGGQEVPLAAATPQFGGPHPQQQQQQAADGWMQGQGSGIGSIRLFGPDCAGFRSPEVAVTFSITSSGLSRAQRNSSSSGSLAAAAGGGGVAGGAGSGAAGADAAAAKPGSKADQSLPTGTNAGAVKGVQPAGGGSILASSSPLKGGKVVGRAYSEVQFVPAQCAWGFPDFVGPSGWEALKGPDGKVCLRCQLKHRE